MSRWGVEQVDMLKQVSYHQTITVSIKRRENQKVNILGQVQLVGSDWMSNCVPFTFVPIPPYLLAPFHHIMRVIISTWLSGSLNIVTEA